MLAALNGIADVVLAVVALYVTGQALRGAWMEKKAEKQADPDKRDELEEDAKTFYAVASLKRPWVLGAIFVATLYKLLFPLLLYFHESPAQVLMH